MYSKGDNVWYHARMLGDKVVGSVVGPHLLDFSFWTFNIPMAAPYLQKLPQMKLPNKQQAAAYMFLHVIHVPKRVGKKARRAQAGKCAGEARGRLQLIGETGRWGIMPTAAKRCSSQRRRRLGRAADL